MSELVYSLFLMFFIIFSILGMVLLLYIIFDSSSSVMKAFLSILVVIIYLVSFTFTLYYPEMKIDLLVEKCLEHNIKVEKIFLNNVERVLANKKSSKYIEE